MTFYNNNPPGRILNRFTKDLIVLDEYIPFIFYEMLQDENTSALFIYSLALRCFGFWIDVICTTMFVAVIIVFFYFKEVNGANIGLVLTQYILLTGYLQWCMRQWTEFENELVSLERFYEYCNIKTETITKEVKQIPKNWPDEGRIVFRDVFLKYNPQEMYILKKLNFMIRPQEKIGIVGRTGTEGNIIIDDADITKLPLEQVRSKISIIPQEPFLFSETMRKNLDPFDENSDDVLWNALEQVELKSVVFELPDGLHCKVFERGSNFSVGQRQLVCLARALVRNNNILVLDEATANVDPHTDDLIQKTMRKKFAHCTVLTIAHRLQTVMDSDRILVMNDGSIEEFDHPFNLLRNKGYFYKLVQSTGKITALNLQNDARE
ncbi:ABC tran domain containing protein, partial [Asbolus verrucosus]